MIAFDIDEHRFHLRAVAVIVEGPRVLLHRLGGDAFWSLPGGRVEAGEDAAQTLRREMLEELDEQVAVGEMLGVLENFFVYEGRRYHELGLYFRVALRPGSRLLAGPGPHEGREGDRVLHVDWFDRARLDEIDMRPRCLAAWLAAPSLQAWQHGVNREPGGVG
jgi:8-oxo-dGTP pyrophosphatase MutT (NUDIX family)